MKRILNIKTFSIHPQRKRDENYILDNIQGIDSYTLLKTHLLDHINQHWIVSSEDNDEEPTPTNQTYIHLTPKDYREYDSKKISTDDFFLEFNDRHRFICGKISRGHFGHKGAVINTRSQQVFKIEENHCVPTPFFFFIAIPRNKDKGFILTEKIGQSGIVLLFSNLLKNLFQEKINNIILKHEDYTENAVIQKYIMDGAFQEIIMTTTLPDNIEDAYGLERYENKPYTLELKIKARKHAKISGDITRKIKSIFSGGTEKFINFENTGFCDSGKKRNYQIKVMSSYKDKQRTINLNDPSKIISGYDINVPEDDAGHSDFQAIKNATYDLLDSFDLKIFDND